MQLIRLPLLSTSIGKLTRLNGGKLTSYSQQQFCYLRVFTSLAISRNMFKLGPGRRRGVAEGIK